ncbi:hypothetical protein FRC16_008535 [Serendipita sp. 398]|nr:hypothetical protein FRC16_008535 [Serendipita sp. 398]
MCQYLLAERPFGTNVYKSKIPLGSADSPPAVFAVKVIPLHGISLRKPHSARNEIVLLSRLSQSNIVNQYSAFYDASSETYELVLEFADLPLHVLLDCPYFSAHRFPEALGQAQPSSSARLSSSIVYYALTKSFIYQIITALCYLHTQSPPIAHRDINPSNILIKQNGLIKIIDFGVVWDPRPTTLTIIGDEAIEFCEEDEGNMRCQVATGVFRAPELMYSPKQYDAPATDLWAMGVTVALFFGPLKLELGSDDEESTDSGSDNDDEKGPNSSNPPYILPARLSRVPFDSSWRRQSIFDASRGEIGLLWSIFQVLGTPTKDSWPDFPGNQGSSAIRFRDAPRQDMSKLLPHLPTESWPLNLVEGFLTYPPEQRLSALTALSSPWFTADGPLLLPNDYPAEDEITKNCIHDIDGASFTDILGPLVLEEERKFEETARMRDEWD